MSIGRISTFLDIYVERDLREKALDEANAQGVVGISWCRGFRVVRNSYRTPEYDALFSGDPYWATECVAGMGLDGQPLVTKSSCSHAAYFDQSGSGAGAEYHRAVVETPSRQFQKVLRPGQPRHILAAQYEK